MFYFDISFLVPLLLPEAASDRIAAFIGTLAVDDLAVSHWVQVGFSSLLARQVRMGVVPAQFAAEADARFEDMVAQSFLVILPTANDFTLAKGLLADHRSGLRAGDALHLAIAQHHRVKAVHTLDKVMFQAGERVGLRLNTNFPQRP
ncbi:MAG: PIN domain-containing protein [Rhodospirillales bacterium]|nr:MAG: PIN domain-containing protein [Rhodospirillales bacterium]